MNSTDPLTVLHAVSVDLDERAFLFPEGKLMNQLRFAALANGEVQIDAVYAFNASRSTPELVRLSLDDARELAKRLVEGVYRAQTQHIASDSTRITLFVIANGYMIQIGDMNNAQEIFLSTSVIWRVCQALLRVVDMLTPAQTH
ncbi:MAG: hypothetical protein HQL56_13305 [Magnetococcales bacterium]|nr:hypothetical protein [Magnetococcales bacterium]